MLLFFYKPPNKKTNVYYESHWDVAGESGIGNLDYKLSLILTGDPISWLEDEDQMQWVFERMLLK